MKLTHRESEHPPLLSHLTLNLEVQNYFVRSPVIAGDTRVIPRILCFHSFNDEAAISMDTAPSINDRRGRAPAVEKQCELSMKGAEFDISQHSPVTDSTHRYSDARVCS